MRGDGEELVAGVHRAVALGDGGTEEQHGRRRDAHEGLEAEEGIGQRLPGEGPEAHRRSCDGEAGNDEHRGGRAVLAEPQRSPDQEREEHVRLA